MVVVSATIIKFFSSDDRSSYSISSQMQPIVWSEASFMCSSWWVALLQRIEISSSHSPLGISILAIAATRLATCERTKGDGQTRFERMAVFAFTLKTGSKFTHRSAYLESFDRFEMRFLQTRQAICLTDSVFELSLISLMSEAKNFF